MSDMQDTMLLGLEGIKKTILHGGTGEIPKCISGSKVFLTFTNLHFSMNKCVLALSSIKELHLALYVYFSLFSLQFL